MKRFVEGADRDQPTLFPECLEDWVDEDNPVRVIDMFVDDLKLADLGFAGVDPQSTGRPSYHPAVLLKLYVYGYLNAVQSSRRLEREANRNVEVMWLTRRLASDHKTIADFRKDNGSAIRKVCARFVELCRRLGLLAHASVAIDGSKFKAVNNRDRNFTEGKMARRMAQIEESVARYLHQLDSADLEDGVGRRSARSRGRSRLLHERTDPRMHRGRHHGKGSQAADIQQQGQGPIRQARLPLRRKRRHVHLPGRRGAGVRLVQTGNRWLEPQTLCDASVLKLQAAEALHD